jgi:hypothetical protein
MDFLADNDALGRIGILVGADDRHPPFEVANIIDAIATHVDQQQFVGLDGSYPYDDCLGIVHISHRNWKDM